MKFERSAGILLHPTSLPGNYGIGTIGKNAYHFIDFMTECGQKLWQVFPLGPTGYGDSPYQSFSTFAGNPLLIDLELLQEEGLLSKEDLNSIPHFDKNNIDFGHLIQVKFELLSLAFQNYKTSGKVFSKECGKFCTDNKSWLDDYSLFMAVKEYHGGRLWTEWEEDIAFRKKGSIEKWTDKLQYRVDYQKFLQYTFFKQWKNLKKYANEKGIKIIGDIPIFIAYDSSDLWANKQYFSVNKKGKLETVAGVPPDYFSETGQLWGNPLYKWIELEKDNFSWWVERIKKTLELVDIIRIDHFRGLDAYWEIPGDAQTAQKGRWVKAPGKKLFEVIKKELGELPIIAEDLGVITESVEELRDHFEFPGMKILQFAFGEGGDNNFLPHHYIKNCVVFTGSHDNDTTRGFFENEQNNETGIYEWAQRYLNYYGKDITFELIRTAYASVANIVIIPMQDILNLGSEARMNFPGKLGGNWTWRFDWDQVNSDIPLTYKGMTEIYDRTTKKIAKKKQRTPDEFLPE
ncbi:MAG: 4-alpha-glucanotransferase [Melioribacteraceae bacterium]|nr:4-alpha-glucanotransferase [Melioribacteraceae bacterium]